MGNKWIIDVLADLKVFAEKNDLPLLADQLDRASEVAVDEIAVSPSGLPPTLVGEKRGIRVIS